MNRCFHESGFSRLFLLSEGRILQGGFEIFDCCEFVDVALMLRMC